MRFLFVVALLISNLAVAQTPSFKPASGFVPDEDTAVAVAVAVLKPIYGAGAVEKQRPFKGRLENGTWHVQGTLPTNMLGGVAEVWIGKDDGRVLRVKHGR